MRPAAGWIPSRGEGRSPAIPFRQYQRNPDPGLSSEFCPMPSTSPLVQSPGPSAPGPSFFLENRLGSCFPGPPTATASSLIPPDTNLTVRSLLNTPQCFLHAPGNEQAPGPGITGLTCWALATPPQPHLATALCPISRPMRFWCFVLHFKYISLSSSFSSKPLQLPFPLSGALSFPIAPCALVWLTPAHPVRLLSPGLCFPPHCSDSLVLSSLHSFPSRPAQH